MKSTSWIPKFKVSIWQKLNPLFWVGNLDDPIPPEWFTGSKLAWFIRNPFHNLGFYVLGFRSHPSTSYGKYPQSVFTEELGFNWTITIVSGWLPLPFISHRGKGWRWYLGWKCPGASLGLEFRKNS